MTSQKCNVCAHPLVSRIESALFGGQSLRTVARQFGNVSKDSLSRHLQHTPEAARDAVRESSGLDATSIGARLADAADDARRARKMLSDAGRFRESARLADVEARMLGTLADRLAVDDLSAVRIAEAQKRIVSMLRGVIATHPEHAPEIVAFMRSEGHDEGADVIESFATATIASREVQS